MGVDQIARRPAVFLDRDGVLTQLVRDVTGEWASPHSIADLRLLPGSAEALRSLATAGFQLFVVSNQPSFAKGKVTLTALRQVARTFEERLAGSGVRLRDAYYCFHHPEGVIPGFGRSCRCRKPSPYFVERAARRYDIDLARSWFIGDRSTDIECGRRAGCRTILIVSEKSRAEISSGPDELAQNVRAAARMILAESAAQGIR